MPSFEWRSWSHRRSISSMFSAFLCNHSNVEGLLRVSPSVKTFLMTLLLSFGIQITGPLCPSPTQSLGPQHSQWHQFKYNSLALSWPMTHLITLLCWRLLKICNISTSSFSNCSLVIELPTQTSAVLTSPCSQQTSALWHLPILQPVRLNLVLSPSPPV